jgi:hypothetical protein
LKLLRQHNKPKSDNKNENEISNNEKELHNNSEDNAYKSKSAITKSQNRFDTDEDSNHDSDLEKHEAVLSLDNKIEKEGEEVEEEKVDSDINKLERRQTILLSATLTHAVEKLAGLTMFNPMFVDAAKDHVEASGGNSNEANEDLVVPQSVVQSYIVTPPKLRMVTLSAYIAGKCRVNNFYYRKLKISLFSDFLISNILYRT